MEIEIGQLLANRSVRQRDVAVHYAKLIRSGLKLDWSFINRAIKDRWSRSGLIRIKKMAWKIVKNKP